MFLRHLLGNTKGGGGTGYEGETMSVCPFFRKNMNTDGLEGLRNVITVVTQQHGHNIKRHGTDTWKSLRDYRDSPPDHRSPPNRSVVHLTNQSTITSKMMRLGRRRREELVGWEVNDKEKEKELS
jgi:hypothetical protein